MFDKILNSWFKDLQIKCNITHKLFLQLFKNIKYL